MSSIHNLFRLFKIYRVFAKHGMVFVLLDLPLAPSTRFFLRLHPRTWFQHKCPDRSVALRRSLEALGPIFVKFGQALSTRPDILPIDIADELSKLQDKVRPFPSEKAQKIIEEAFKKSIPEIFASFETEPLASASMAQVHAAELPNGREVVVKVLRPGIEKIIKQDISLLKTLARALERIWPLSRRFKPSEIVAEFEHTLIDELDLQREAANAGQLRRNFAHSPLLYIPEIFWDYTRDNVMVMERIYGIPVSDTERLKQHRIDIKKLAERGVEIFFTQVFRDCFFHADMHPGNIFVSPTNPHNPQYICVDFGIIGTLNDKDKRYIAENLYAFFSRDYRRVAQLHVESGWVSPNTRIDEFESAIRTVCEPIFEKPLKDISFGQVVMRLFQVAQRFEMEVQPQLILLQKTLLAIEGLGRQLYPDLDLWVTAKPFLEKWLREQVGPKAFWQELKANLPFFAEQLPNMPRLVFEILEIRKQALIDAQLRLKAERSSKISFTARKAMGVGLVSCAATVGIVEQSFGQINPHTAAVLLGLAVIGFILGIL